MKGDFEQIYHDKRGFLPKKKLECQSREEKIPEPIGEGNLIPRDWYFCKYSPFGHDISVNYTDYHFILYQTIINITYNYLSPLTGASSGKFDAIWTSVSNLAGKCTRG